MRFLFALPLLISLFVDAQVPIADARKMRAGKIVTINGVITASFGDLSFIQDNSGGIAIYGPGVKIFDSLSVTGTLSKYNGMLEIEVISKVEFGLKRVVEPKIIGVGNVPDHEGELIQLK